MLATPFTRSPTRPTATPPVRGPSASLSPACPADSRTCAGCALLLEGVGDVLQEQEAQADVLVLGSVHAAAQGVGHLPELGFVADGGGSGAGGSRAFLSFGHVLPPLGFAIRVTSSRTTDPPHRPAPARCTRAHRGDRRWSTMNRFGKRGSWRMGVRAVLKPNACGRLWKRRSGSVAA